MIDVDMNSMPSNVMGREVRLWARSSLGLSKDPRPMRRPNI